MIRILIDTNFFTVPCQFKVDIFEEFNRLFDEEYEVFTIDLVKEELDKISKGNSKEAIAMRVGLVLIDKKNVKILKTNGKSADRTLYNLSGPKTYIATNDSKLRYKIEAKGGKAIFLRNKSYLEKTD